MNKLTEGIAMLSIGAVLFVLTGNPVIVVFGVMLAALVSKASR